MTPPPVPPVRRPGICPWKVRRLEIPRGNFVPAVGETAESLDEPEASPDLYVHMTRHVQLHVFSPRDLYYLGWVKKANNNDNE